MNKKNVIIIMLNFLLLLSIACNTSNNDSSNTPNPASPPPAPTIVYGFAENESVVIKWNPISEATSYNLYYTLGSTAGKESMKIEKVTSPYSVKGLINGNRYAFAITSVNANGESGLSPIVLAIPVLPNIYPPTKIFATAENKKITLSWDTASGVTSYNLYYAMDTTVTKDLYFDKFENVISPHTIENLNNGTQYAFGITSVKDNRESEISIIARAIPIATNISAPIKITAISENEQITLKWNSVTGALSYNLYYAMDTTVTKIKYDKKIENVTSAYSVIDLINGAEYAFGITSVNNDGESNLSPIVNAVPIQGNNPPKQPSNPSPFDSAINISVNPTLSWTCGDPDNGDAVTYDVYFDTTDASAKVRENQTASTFSTTGLNVNKKYFWKIVARDKSNAETSGDIWEFNTPTGTRINLSKIGWTNYTSGANVNAIVDDGIFLWVGGNGGLVRLEKLTGNMTHYNKANSVLPDNIVNTIAKDINGDIWIGTQNGLVKFDGITDWTLYNKENTSLPNNDIVSIAIDNDGNKWIGNDDAGLTKFDGTEWTTYHRVNQGEYEDTRTIAIDNDGNKWIGSSGKGLAEFDGTNWTIYDTSNSNLPDNNIWSVAIDTDGSIWCGGDNGLAKFDGINWYIYNTQNTPFTSNTIRDIAIDSYGNKWIGTYNGFFMFDGETWTDYTPGDIGLISNDILSITIGLDGNKWIGFYGGLAKFDGTNWITYNIGNSELPDNFIRSMAFDSSGNKWIGTNFGGLSNFDGTNWITYLDVIDNLGDRHVDNIKIDKDGIKWIETWDGLVKFDGMDWTVYNNDNSELPDGSIGDLTIDSNNNKWLLVNNFNLKEFRLVKFDNTNWYIYNIADSIIDSGYPRNIAVDKLGNVWIFISFKEGNDGNPIVDDNGDIIGGGLAKFDGTNWTLYNKNNSGLTSNWIESIAIDNNDNLWLGTLSQPKINGEQVTYSGGGLVKFNGTDWTVYDTSNSFLIGNFAAYIKVDNNGNTWGITATEQDRESIFKFNGNTWTLFDNSENSGVPSESGNVFNIDNSGGLWFGTRGGLGYLNPDDLTTTLPNISVSPFFHDFGKVEKGGNSTQTFIITNNGGSPLVVDMCSLTGENVGEFNIKNSPWTSMTVAPYDGFSIEVEFSPISIGAKTAILSIPSNDPDMPVITVNLKGDAQDSVPPVVVLTNPSHESLNIPLNTTITVTFSEEVDPETINVESFYVIPSDGYYPIFGSVTCSGATATFTPAYNLEYNKVYNVTITSAVKDLAGNSLVEAFSTWSFLTQMIGAKTYGGSYDDYAVSIQQTTDSGYVIAENTNSYSEVNDIGVLKLNLFGEVEWHKTYDNFYYDEASSIQQTTDGGYIVTGTTQEITKYKIWILKLDSGGSITWQKTYSLNVNDYAYSIKQTADGGYVVAGHTEGATTNILILKLNSEGIIEWQKTYDNAYDYANSIQQTTDGGYIIGGNTTIGYDFSYWVLKLNSNGAIEWEKTFSGSGYGTLRSIQQTIDEGYILTGDINSDIWILKLNSNGTIAWQKSYDEFNVDAYYSNSEEAYSIQQTTDGGYIVAGQTSDAGENTDILILKLNSNGSIAWQKTYGGEYYTDTASSIRQTTDGGYIVGGKTYSFGEGYSDIWILKLGASGEIVFNPLSGAYMNDANLSATNTEIIDVDTHAIVTDTEAAVVDTNVTATDNEIIINQQAP